MMLSGLEGRTAFVTGAGGGIGLAVVDLLERSGVSVYATDLKLDALKTRSSEAVKILELDVRNAEQVMDAVKAAKSATGHIDFGVNVAGVLSTLEVRDTSEEEWNRVFAVNATGVYFVSRALAAVMVPRRQGCIVTVGSNSAAVARRNMSAYAASKAAAAMFMRCLGLELAEFGIRCNVVAAGSTRTPMQTALWKAGTGEEAVLNGSLSMYRAGIPLRKLATPADIANAVVFLLSDEASHITMADIYVDGGASLRG